MPAFLAARLRSTLDEVQEVVDAVEAAPSIARAAETLRPADATRLIPHASFALSERTTAYLPALEQAIRRRGIPKRLYVDSVPRNKIYVLCPTAICGGSGQECMKASGQLREPAT